MKIKVKVRLNGKSIGLRVKLRSYAKVKSTSSGIIHNSLDGRFDPVAHTADVIAYGAQDSGVSVQQEIETVEQTAREFYQEYTNKVAQIDEIDRQQSQDISANTRDIAKNTQDIAKNAQDISKNTKDIATNAGNIQQNTEDISKNTGDISQLQEGLSAETGARQQEDQLLSNRIDSLEGQTVRLLYTEKTNPTAQEIQSFVISQGYTNTDEWAGIAVVIAGTYHIWHCYSGREELSSFEFFSTSSLIISLESVFSSDVPSATTIQILPTLSYYEDEPIFPEIKAVFSYTDNSVDEQFLFKAIYDPYGDTVWDVESTQADSNITKVLRQVSFVANTDAQRDFWDAPTAAVYSDSIYWQDDGVDTVTEFTNSSPGIIRGSTNIGYVGRSDNATGKVNGFDGLITTAQISALFVE